MTILTIPGLSEMAREAFINQYISATGSNEYNGVILNNDNIVQKFGSNIVNAFEHSYASAYMSDQFGTEAATKLGVAKEMITFWELFNGESNYDLVNDKIGRDFYTQATSEGQGLEEVAKLLFDDIYRDPYTDELNPDMQPNINKTAGLMLWPSDTRKSDEIKIIEKYVNDFFEPIKKKFNQSQKSFGITVSKSDN